MNYGDKIRQLREGAGLSKYAFAKLSGFDRSNITNIESGKRGISGEKFREIKEAYDTLIDSEKRQKYDAELQQSESLRDGAFIDVTQLEDFAFGEEDIGWIDELVNNFSSPLNRLDEDLEILLSRRESREGGMLSIDLPSYFGLGFGFSYSPRRRFNLRIPAGIKNGEIRNIYVPELDFWIRVRFTIS